MIMIGTSRLQFYEIKMVNWVEVGYHYHKVMKCRSKNFQTLQLF